MKEAPPGGVAVQEPIADGAALDTVAGPHDATRSAGRDSLALAVAGVGVWEFEAASGGFTLDETERRLLGLGAKPAGALPEDAALSNVVAEDRERLRRALHAAAEHGRGFDESFRVQVADETRWLHSIGRTVRIDGDARIIGVSFDATAEGRALAARDLLLREMNHRIKNLFAVIGSLVSLCAREAESPRALAEDLGNRIAAMGRAHSLTQQTPDRHGDVERALDLHELVEAVVEPARTGQSIVIEGEAVTVPIALLTPLGLIFHEWATNAAKYGALADRGGSLAVRWSVDGQGLTTIDWRETWAHARAAGSGRPGFGTRLIDATVAQLRARLTGEQGDGFLMRRLELSGLG